MFLETAILQELINTLLVGIEFIMSIELSTTSELFDFSMLVKLVSSDNGSRSVLRMPTLDTSVDGSIPASICFLLEQETLSALLQSTQLSSEYQVGTTS